VTAAAGSPVTAEKLLTAEELAARWQLPGKTPEKCALRMARDGIIPPGAVVKLGRYVRFRLDKIEQFERDGGADV
jgi:hypothetical protein